MPTELPDTPAGRRLTWVLDLFARGFEIEEEEFRGNLTKEFNNQVPPGALTQIGNQLSTALKDFTIDKVDGELTGVKLTAVLSLPAKQKWRAALIVDPNPPHLIAGLQFAPAPDLSEPLAKSWPELEQKLTPMASKVNFLAAEIVEDDLVPIVAINPDESLALGSTFKLYILGEIARQIDEGALDWEEQIPIDVALKSWPSGEMRNEMAGAKFPLQHYAEQMISVSDNTATDHLLFKAGRENVEAFQKEMGHSSPEANMPFISTKEMFLLKLVLSDAELESFRQASSEERRKSLAKVGKKKLPKLDLETVWSEPRYIDVEWFASADDLGRAMIKLRELIARPGLKPLEKVLSINPGVQFDRYAWSFVGYKGGSEPGVLNMTWLLKRLDDRWFFMTVGLNDPDKAVDDLEAVALMFAAGSLLVQQRKSPKKRRKRPA